MMCRVLRHSLLLTMKKCTTIRSLKKNEIYFSVLRAREVMSAHLVIYLRKIDAGRSPNGGSKIF